MPCDIWFIKFRLPLGRTNFSFYVTAVRVLGWAGKIYPWIIRELP